MKIVVLGAGGFIGSHLTEHLIRQARHDVVGLDITDEKLAGIAGPNFRFVHSNAFDDTEMLSEIVEDSDVVVDLIAYANPSIYVSSPLEVFELNFVANMRVVDMCVEHNARLIQYSTSEIYGAPEADYYYEDRSNLVMGPITQQRWIYASAKQLLERVLHAHGLKGTLNYTIIRPFNFLGPRLDYLVSAGTMGGPRVMAHFMSALLNGGPMYLVNGGDVHRSFTHIDDASSAFLTLLEHDGAKNEIFNLGNPSIDISIRDFALLLKDVYEELTGVKADNELIEVSGDEFYGKGYADTNRVPPDISKLNALGWEPKNDLRTAVMDTMRYYLDPAHQVFVSD